ncbi:FUSC family protein [Bordetella hinzii]|uniref:FUSC family protein n=1 Tax=Bordetella hinzii TaxID=103855 RepID=UPI001C00BB04|nr:FUSC family protein [Bordetella hinzii]QWF37684.1 FUSC family protein [Bordetella hinzii]QWF42229.1 FUSC family protein [Bordetella hinzii]QWF46770.1 FUSC family protein [Bordetella hinzii]QWF51309.1 FUSC family protein [Bordetella hinzii]QWF56279.1 FUSC family protein [Bordetella hinzii]
MIARILSYRPSLSDAIFSAKNFIASMLALYLSLSLDFQRPAWAMATAYIIAHPLSGALTSKAVYRVIGTLFGAAVAVLLVPRLVNAPLLMSGVLALWVGLCLYISMLDRRPRSYIFMLAGYTAAIVGFSSAAEPLNVFDTALARCEEITLGILCATLVSHLVLPRHVGGLIAMRIEDWLRDSANLLIDSLHGEDGRKRLPQDMQQLAAGVAELRTLFVHLAYEKPQLRGGEGALRVLHDRMALMLPIIGAISDRVTALCGLAGGQRPADIAQLTAVLERWLRPGADEADLQALRAAIAGLRAAAPAGSSGTAAWEGILRGSLAMRLERLIELRQDAHDLWRHIRRGETPRRRTARRLPSAELRDHGVALRCGVAAALSVGFCALAWIGTGWPSGVLAVQMASVGACILSFMDDPVPALKTFLQCTLLSALIVALYLFGVLPLIHHFALLVMVLAVFLLPLGMMQASMAHFGIALPMIANSILLLNLHNVQSEVFDSYLNGAIASVIGFAISTIVISFVRAMNPDTSVRRLIAGGWAELGDVARGRLALTRDAFARRMYDRVAMLAPRASATAPAVRARALRTSFEFGAAVNLVELRRLRDELPLAPRAAMDDLLGAMARLFEARRKRREGPDEQALRCLDTALTQVRREPPARGLAEILAALAGLRLAFFGAAPPYRG